MLLPSFILFDHRQWRWPHFSPRELACRCAGRHCDGEYWHDPEFLDSLEALRSACGGALIVNSGHRCPGWNAEVGGAAKSCHLEIAVDISLRNHDRHLILAKAQTLGFTGIGLGENFIHLDRRANPARWFYPGSEASWRI